MIPPVHSFIGFGNHRAIGDPSWRCINYGAAWFDQRIVANHRDTSCLLPLKKAPITNSPTTKETILIRRLSTDLEFIVHPKALQPSLPTSPADDAGERLPIMARDRSAGENVWSIVLAGGEGERLKPFVLRWLGRHRPKQYCTFVGTRSMFEHTLDRATLVASPKRTVVVAARHHRHEMPDQPFAHRPHTLIEQPNNRDTAAGIFLPLSYIRAHDPHALVVIQPSDHFIYPEQRFVATVRQSVAWTQTMPDRLLLLGVQPDRLETEYGWIRRGAQLNGTPSSPVHAVSSFIEKPGLSQADTALRDGGLWNTLVITATVDALWQAGWTCFPDLMSLFEWLCSAWGTPDESAVIEDIYRDMPKHNFSSHLLQQIPERVAVMELTGLLWSDWGKPERIAETIRRIGKTPAFPLDCLNRPFAPHPVPQRAKEVLATA
jgi:mannose-1-phosphate guanylyltransferase